MEWVPPRKINKASVIKWGRGTQFRSIDTLIYRVDVLVR